MILGADFSIAYPFQTEVHHKLVRYRLLSRTQSLNMNEDQENELNMAEEQNAEIIDLQPVMELLQTP